LRISPDRGWLAVLEQPPMPSIADLARPEQRLAGLRIDPRNFGPSKPSYYSSLALRPLDRDERQLVTGLPEAGMITDLKWSPDAAKLLVEVTTDQALELYLVDRAAATARPLPLGRLNGTMAASAFSWIGGEDQILCLLVPDRDLGPPKSNPVPTGPVIQESLPGTIAPARTYQDLLKNHYDERCFAYYSRAQLVLHDLRDGTTRPIGPEGSISYFSPSPDGNYICVQYVERPYSYQVPVSRFPQRTLLFDRQGQQVREVAYRPLAEDVPQGFGAVPRGGRAFQWRNDVPATLCWVEALDEGDPRREAEFRDELLALPAPFTGEPNSLLKLSLRFGGILWGTGEMAIIQEWWWANRQEVTLRWQPDHPGAAPQVLFDRSWQDIYNDPGQFQTDLNEFGRSVLLVDADGETLFLTGQGASPEGNRPFVDTYHLPTGQTERLWRSEPPHYEIPLFFTDTPARRILTRRESRTEVPNFFLRELLSGTTTQITHFPNPYAELEGVSRELVRYQRADGVELTGKLYLPAGYDAERDGPLPALMWAYPREYKSADDASQVQHSPYEFFRFGPHSPLFWVTRGYAILDDFAMPIVGEGEEEPNERFVEQLRMNAQAAVDMLVAKGIADPRRLAVGGHSYGAFMTANLLAHTELFAAGIARSGAYNRSLTPFGFQSEERTYWEAQDVYHQMSPFNHADRIQAPILLIHGQDDNNSGTFPLQSERFFAALRGQGTTARLVLLPKESHGYRARESILHMLWEMDVWLENYVKNRPLTDE
jgi:dipeptidyl aminopeptidase/acylaminoacyl peptidase